LKRHPLGASIGARAGTGARLDLGNGIWGREKISEQRYSGKPDGVAGTPKKMSTDNSQQTKDFVLIGIVRYVSMCIFYRNH